MTNKSPFDDHIKKQFNNYQPEAPVHIWENILAKKEKRKPGGFLFTLAGRRYSLAIITIATIAGSTMLLKSFQRNNTDNPPYITSVAAKNNDEPINNGKSINTDKLELSASIKNNITPTNTDLGKNQPDAITAKRLAYIEEVRKPASVIRVADQQAAAVNKTNITSKSKRASASSAAFTHSPSYPNYTDDQIELQKAGSRKSKKTSGKFAINIKGADLDGTVDETFGTADDKTPLSLERLFLDINPIAVEKQAVFNIKSLGISPLNVPCPESEKNAAGNKKYIEFYGGPDYAFRTYDDTANSAYLEKRKASTSFKSAFSFGIRYTRVFNNAMSFRTGINFSQVNEKFTFAEGHIIQLVYITDGNGDTTGGYATTGSRYKTTQNRYRTIDIPLMIGYEMGNGKLHSNINAGFVVNVYSWQKGDVLNDAYQPVTITTGKTSSPYQFKTNAGLGFMGAASFYYKLTDHLHLLAEPYFRYNFSAANKAEITLKQKYTTTGLRLGLRIDF